MTAPAPDWECEFDLADEAHCLGVLDNHLDHLSPPARRLLTTHLPDVDEYTVDDLHNAATAVLDELEELDRQGPDPGAADLNHVTDELEELERAVDQHQRVCQCGLDTWENDERFTYQELLDGTGDWASWAVSADSDTFVDYAPLSLLTVSTLWQSLNSRDGWQKVHLSWYEDQRLLHATFWSYPSVWTGYALALTEDQDHLVDMLFEALVGAPPTSPPVDPVLEAVHHPHRAALLSGFTGHPDDKGSPMPFTQAQEVLQEVPQRVLAAAESLMRTDTRQPWAGPLTELIAVATSVVA